MDTNDCLAVIPARGGSRRIPGKNTRPLLGKPLLAYTVEAALQCGLFARVVVSTDTPAVAQVARDSGAEVPFLRDASLADDRTPVSAATADALRWLDPGGDRYPLVCQLMPTCPLRPAAAITASYQQFTASGARAQISVVRYGWQNPWWALRLGDRHALEPLFADRLRERSQDLPELYCPSGAVWWARADTLRQEGSFHVPDRTGWVLPWQQGLDIDTEDDWALAECLLRLRHGPEDRA